MNHEQLTTELAEVKEQLKRLTELCEKLAEQVNSKMDDQTNGY